MNFTIDASIFVATARVPEAHHAASIEFLRQVEGQAVRLFCPTLVLAECAAAIARQTDKPILAEKIVVLIEHLPNLLLVPLDASLAHGAAQIAITQRLRGADAIYAAVAETFDATLITWDAEMLQRGSTVVSTLTPTDWLKQQRADQQEVSE